MAFQANGWWYNAETLVGHHATGRITMCERPVFQKPLYYNIRI